MKELDESSSLPSKIERTALGLRDVLFDELEAMRAGKSTPARARSVAMLANTILQSVTTEIQYHAYASAVSKLPPPIADLGVLKLGGSDQQLTIKESDDGPER